MKILPGILVLCVLVAGTALDRSRAEEELPFYFQDRPGDIPPLPVERLEIPADGFEDGAEFERWLVGTIWEGGGGDANLRLVFAEPGRAEFTWSNPAWWKVVGNKRCSLSHERSHWWCDLVFSDDYQTLRYENGGRSNGQGFSWGEAKLVGRK